MGLIPSFIAFICKTAKCIHLLTLILNFFYRILFRYNEKNVLQVLNINVDFSFWLEWRLFVLFYFTLLVYIDNTFVFASLLLFTKSIHRSDKTHKNTPTFEHTKISPLLSIFDAYYLTYRQV